MSEKNNKTVRKARKKRNDRTHVIYEIVVGKKNYIGITAKTQTTVLRSVKVRFQKHAERARNERHVQWPLYIAIRKYGIENATITILETVRGKAAAHTLEVELIKTRKPKLNLASN